MPSDPDGAADLSPRLRRAVEIVYGVEGVTAARLWAWSGRVAIGVRGAAPAADLLRRVEAATLPLREPNETWDFGWLDEA